MTKLSSNEAMLDMITDLQSSRMDSQRAELRPVPKKPAKETSKGSSLPGLRHQNTVGPKPEDDFLDMIARVQGARLEDQRTEMPRPKPEEQRSKTVPDDDFFALLMRAQAGRMEDQRATIPLQDNRTNKGNSNSKK
ncbi:unnamed protein product [Arctia plantaginis]|uniref:G-protein-signaling modulator 2 n=1 Tax=Arctia plantaginis TaxID=874455 RepID=A0A8S1BAN7_ARCPL|nr:unnamed protein product [Arctia plantaginis]